MIDPPSPPTNTSLDELPQTAWREFPWDNGFCLSHPAERAMRLDRKSEKKRREVIIAAVMSDCLLTGYSPLFLCGWATK
jgi:hypothetical protein